MRRHRANELLNEASKLATLAAMQIAAGRNPSDEPDSNFVPEFDNSAFKIGRNNKTNKFDIQISDIPQDVCEQMQNMVENSIMQMNGECDGTSPINLTFNDDLSKIETPSKISSVDGPSNDDDSDCTADTKMENSECQVCFNGAYIDSDAACQRLYPGEKKMCIDGHCITPEDSGLGGCTYNSDCTGIINGIDCDSKTCYCSYFDLNRDWGGGNIFPGIRSGEERPDAGSGICQEAKYSSLSTERILSNDNLDWYSAKNFCAAHGMRMITAKELGITPSKLGEYFSENGRCYCTDHVPDYFLNSCSWEGCVPPLYLSYNFWLQDVYTFENYLYGLSIFIDEISICSREAGILGRDMNALCVK